MQQKIIFRTIDFHNPQQNNNILNSSGNQSSQNIPFRYKPNKINNHFYLSYHQHKQSNISIQSNFQNQQNNLFKISSINNYPTQINNHNQLLSNKNNHPKYSFHQKQSAKRKIKKISNSNHKSTLQPTKTRITKNSLPKIQKLSSQNRKNYFIDQTNQFYQESSIDKNKSISSARYSLAPNLNLQKTIYLFKKQPLDRSTYRILYKNQRNQKSYQLKANTILKHEQLQNLKLDQDQKLTGLKTTLYQKSKKSNQKNISHGQIQKIVNEVAKNKRKKKLQIKGQEFTPWYTLQQSTSI